MRRKLISSFVALAVIVLGGWGAHTLYGTRVSATPDTALGGNGRYPPQS